NPKCSPLPESIGGLSFLNSLDLGGNNFSSLPGSLSQLSHLGYLWVNGCKKLEVLPELPPSIEMMNASYCTSLREVPGSSKHPFKRRYNEFINCPKLLKNVSIDNEGFILKTECLDSSVTSQGFIHQLCDFLGYLDLETNRCKFFLQDSGYDVLDILYHGNSMSEWFTNRSTENHVKVELPSDWCYDKIRGFGTCVYTRYTRIWKEAKKFVTFSFFEKNNEDVEVKECGVRLICDEDIEQEADKRMLQGLPTPTQHGGFLSLNHTFWSW
ncbi:NB-ARC domains-containing protein, partial [Tanacetum coccineum]